MWTCHTKTGFMHSSGPSISDADVEQQLGRVAGERGASVTAALFLKPLS